MGRASQQKGNKGQVKAAAALEALGIRAASGRAEDLYHAIEGLHLEVKYVKRIGTYDIRQWLLQASEDAMKKDATPVLIVKAVSNQNRNNKWLVIHTLEDWPAVAELLQFEFQRPSRQGTGPQPMDGSP